MAEIRDWGTFKAEQEARLVRQTGEGLAAWGAKIAGAGLDDQPALRAWLAERGVTGYLRMFLSWERFGYPDFINASADELVDGQYADRPELRPIYDGVVEAALSLGEVAVQTRKTYVSLVTPRRTFIRVQATTRKRVDVALRLAAEPGGAWCARGTRTCRCSSALSRSPSWTTRRSSSCGAPTTRTCEPSRTRD